jgi:hypothetical protein
MCTPSDSEEISSLPLTALSQRGGEENDSEAMGAPLTLNSAPLVDLPHLLSPDSSEHKEYASTAPPDQRLSLQPWADVTRDHWALFELLE